MLALLSWLSQNAGANAAVKDVHGLTGLHWLVRVAAMYESPGTPRLPSSECEARANPLLPCRRPSATIRPRTSLPLQRSSCSAAARLRSATTCTVRSAGWLFARPSISGSAVSHPVFLQLYRDASPTLPAVEHQPHRPHRPAPFRPRSRLSLTLLAHPATDSVPLNQQPARLSPARPARRQSSHVGRVVRQCRRRKGPPGSRGGAVLALLLSRPTDATLSTVQQRIRPLRLFRPPPPPPLRAPAGPSC